jgi:hypothetical protein
MFPHIMGRNRLREFENRVQGIILVLFLVEDGPEWPKYATSCKY